MLITDIEARSLKDLLPQKLEELVRIHKQKL